jgi:hypothetical protein
MKHTVLFLTILFFSVHFSFAQYQMEEGYLQTTDDQKEESIYTFKHLRIYPLLAGQKFKAAHKDIGKYTTLKEALEKELISITETENRSNSDNLNINNAIVNDNDLEVQSNDDQRLNQINTDQNIQVQQNVQGIGGAQVNTLYIQNISKDTIYIMAGEVVKGGKQDRVLAQDMILPPNGEKVDISVFCVERNRWSYGSNEGSGNFDKYFSLSSNSVRQKVIQEKNQSAVWEEVGKTVKKNNTETNTGTYTSLVNSETYNKELKAYLDHFTAVLEQHPNCVGFVGVSGDKIIGCDIFATADLFKKQSETILKGYITEAVTNGDDVSVSNREVMSYLMKLLSSEADKQEEMINKLGGQYKYKNKRIHITTF